jgi:CHAT domain-containing protein
MLFSRQGGEGSQEIRLSQFREVAPRVAFALARVGRIDEAVVAFELSRAQLLIQALERGPALRRAPDLDVEVQTGALPSTAVTRHAFDIDEIKAAAQEVPFLYLVYTDRGGLALLVRHDKVNYVALPELDAEKVEGQVRAYLAGLESPNFEGTLNALDNTTRWLWDAIMCPVLEALHGADAVVLVAGGLLGLLPLHAAWTPDPNRPTRRRYALDTTVFSYAPSARALGFARAPATSAIKAAAIARGLIVANPAPVSDEPLQFAEEEANVVKWHFPLAEELLGAKASLRQVSDALSAAEIVHLACHGFADLRTPLDSGLTLAGDETLSVPRRPRPVAHPHRPTRPQGPRLRSGRRLSFAPRGRRAQRRSCR